MPDQPRGLHACYLLVVSQGDGKQELVILATIHGGSDQVHIQFLGHECGLIVDGNAVLIHTAAHTRILANVQQFARETIAHVHHGGWTDAQFTQLVNDIPARLRLELTLDNILLTCKVWLKIILFHARAHTPLALQ